MTESDDTRTITVRVPSALADWVSAEFPHGFKQTFVLQCFQTLQHVMTEGALPPHSEYARTTTMLALNKLANTQTDKGEEE